MTDHILQLMEQRRIKISDPFEYKSINKIIRRECAEAKEKWLNQQCLEIENKLNINTRLAHQKINEITGKSRCSSSSCAKAKNGSILMEKQDILNRWFR